MSLIAEFLMMASMEQTDALKRIIIFIKTIARNSRAIQIMIINIGFGILMVAVGATPVSLLPPILLGMGCTAYCYCAACHWLWSALHLCIAWSAHPCICRYCEHISGKGPRNLSSSPPPFGTLLVLVNSV